MTAGTLTLRPYQDDCVTAVRDAWRDHRRVAAVLATGAGKTVIVADLLRQHLSEHGGRAVVLAHTHELVSQMASTVTRLCPDHTVGIVEAQRDESRRDIVVASVQSLRSERRRERVRGVSCVVVDECHHAAAATYRTVMTHYGCYAAVGEGEGAVALGVTATLVRGGPRGRGALHGVWETVAYRYGITDMVRDGYLVKPRGLAVVVPDLDLSRVRSAGGDYVAADAGEATERSMAPRIVAAAYREHAAGRRAALFAPTVSAAYAYAAELAAVGVRVGTVHGGLPAADRARILTDLNTGRIDVVTNCAVLTEGWDCPHVSCVIVARLTRSEGLYQQMAGRGLRPVPGIPVTDQDCLIMDVTGTGARHTLRTAIDLSPPPQRPPAPERDTAPTTTAGGFRPPVPEYDGDTRTVAFDPLTGLVDVTDRSVWGWRTAGACRYMPVLPQYSRRAATGRPPIYVAVVPVGGGYRVVWCTQDPSRPLPDGRRGGEHERHGKPRAAMLSAQRLATAYNTNARDLSQMPPVLGGWADAPASADQLALAESLGLTVPAGATRGTVGGLVQDERARRRLAPIVEWYEKHGEDAE